MDCRRNREDELKGIWQSWDDAKKMHFRDKYGDVAQLLFVKLDNALLKAMVRFWDPTYRCFMFNEVDMVLTIEEDSTLLHYDFRDLLRIYWKQNTDFRGPLANVMGLLIDTVKASGDRHLALFTFAVYELIVFLKALGYVSVELADFLFQIEKRVNLAHQCLYKHFCKVFGPSTMPIEEFLESEWPLYQSIEEWVQNLSTLTYQRNRMEGSMDDSEHGTHWVQWSFVGSLNWHMKRHQLFIIDGSQPIRGQRKVPDDVAELTEKIHDLEIRLRGKDEEIQRLEADPSLRANELQKVFAQQAEEICKQIEELKTESTPFVTKNELAMKLLKVAQARYQKFIKAMRRKKNDEWRFSLWQ
ncbi:hypothetical protein Goklo_012648 [Gossypium klotzschianum]|uniref:DUF7745 domain-containing protein n=1 Tax=Gossypium klotzschianum TaxID=34286 RepID=A0A7J8VD21_9ROSI|nr:hypothetical protein [Gossypium klotzschianum]